MSNKEKYRFTNSMVVERRGQLLEKVGSIFAERKGKFPDVTGNNGDRIECVLDSPIFVGNLGYDSKLVGFIKAFNGIVSNKLRHGVVNLFDTKIVSTGYLSRDSEEWIFMTVVNGSLDPYAVWVGSENKYMATNSMGNAKEITFPSERNEWQIGLFDELEQLFTTSLKDNAGEIIYF